MYLSIRTVYWYACLSIVSDVCLSLMHSSHFLSNFACHAIHAHGLFVVNVNSELNSPLLLPDGPWTGRPSLTLPFSVQHTVPIQYIPDSLSLPAYCTLTSLLTLSSLSRALFYLHTSSKKTFYFYFLKMCNACLLPKK